MKSRRTLRASPLVVLALAMLLIPVPVNATTAAPGCGGLSSLVQPSEGTMTPEEYAATQHAPDPNAVYCPQNDLVIDASTGKVLEWTDNGHEFTTVRVRGVSAETGPFQLYTPDNVWSFRNATSTPAGEVVLPFQHMKEGTWTLTRGAGTGQTLVVEFQAPLDIVSKLMGGYNSYSTAQPKPSCYAYTACTQNPNCGWGTTNMGSENKLVPVGILHAPYQGTSTHDSTYTSTRTFVFGPAGISSSTQNTYTMTAANGGTNGRFQTARFVLYMTWDSCSYNSPRYYSSNIDYWAPGTTFHGVQGSNFATDWDDATSIPGSVYFDNRYWGADTYVDPRYGAPGSSSTEGVSRTDIGTFGASTTIQGRYFDFNIQFNAENGRSYYYAYTFYAGKPFQYVDYVRNNGQSWAFCTPGNAGC